MTDRDLTMAELAELLQMSTRWVRQQVAARAIPHHRRGRAVRFTPGDIAEIRERMGAEPAVDPTRVPRLRLVRADRTRPGTPPPSEPQRPPDRPAGPHTPPPPPGPLPARDVA